MPFFRSLITGTCVLNAAVVLSTESVRAGDLYEASHTGPVSLQFDAGLANIDAKEIVFQGSDQLSRLDWKSKGVLLLRGAINLEIGPDWAVRAEGKTGKDGNGHMTDYDWISPFAKDQSDNGWSHRSLHDDTRLDHYYSGSVEINRTLIDGNSSFLSAGIGGRYTEVQWSAYGGSYIYSVNQFRDSRGVIPDGEKGITYRQTMPAVYANMRGSQTFGAWSLSGGLELGTLIKAEAPDNHWLRDLDFNDMFDWAPVYGATAGIAYSVTPNISIYANAAADMTNFGRGDTTVRDTTTNTTTAYSNAAGAKFSTASISLGVKGNF